MSEFHQKLFLLILDKVMIEVPILILGYLLNRAMETFKSKKVIENEIEKTKINKLAEVYSALADYEYCVHHIQTLRILILQTEVEYELGKHKLEEDSKGTISKHPESKAEFNALQGKLKSGFDKISEGHKNNLNTCFVNKFTIQSKCLNCFCVLRKSYQN